MSQLTLVEQGDGRFLVDGDLTFATINKRTLKSMKALAAHKDIMIDLGQVQNTDSAGLALMIEWIRYCRGRRAMLRFSNVPAQLLSLAHLSGFDKDAHFAVHLK